MLKFIIIAVVAYVLGVFGWAQIIGSFQNIRWNSGLWVTIIIWIAVLGATAYFAIAKFNGIWPLLIGYGISLVQVLATGRIE